MEKTIGDLSVKVWNPYPVWIDIIHATGRIQISHLDLADLKHLVSEAEKYAKAFLPEKQRQEV